MSDFPEIIVVGAGPGGSTAAAALARRGRDVLLLDRAVFPRDKTCGDGVPPGTVRILNELGAGEALRAASFQTIDGIRIVSARGREWSTRFRSRIDNAAFYIAPRSRFDDLVRRHAVACGARFLRANVLGPWIDGGRVVGVHAQVDGVERIIGARVVVGADGATSAVARGLVRGKSPAVDRGVAIRAYMDGIQTIPETVEFHFSAPYAPGYAWVFPLGPETANVGVIMRADRFKRGGRKLRELLDHFLAQADLRRRVLRRAEVRDIATWQLPYDSPRRSRRAFDGALLVGDAASMVDSLTGEGIHNAVASGAIAAEVADEALAHGDTSLAALAPYERRCDDVLGPLFRRSRIAQRYVAAFPPVLEALFVLVGMSPERVNRWINRRSSDFVVHGDG